MLAIMSTGDQAITDPKLSQTETNPAGDVNDEQQWRMFSAQVQIFLPTFVIAFSYTIAWLAMLVAGATGLAISRMLLLVLATGVPLLLVHAFWRYQTIRLEIGKTAVRYHRGWPQEFPIELPYPLIERAYVRRGLSGRLFGGGTVVLRLITRQRVAITDLRSPDEAAKLINHALAPKGSVDHGDANSATGAAAPSPDSISASTI